MMTEADYGKRKLDKIKETAYFKWLDSGCPAGKDGEFWEEAEKEWNLSKEENIRYIAAKGLREIARGKNLVKVVERVIELEKDNHGIGTSDVVVWDMGTENFPTMSIAASTCRGWLTINLPNREYLSDSFGLSFTYREKQVLKQFLDVWKVEGGQRISDIIRNIYEQTYVKNFKPNPKQIRLNPDEFKVFINKLLTVVNS